MTAVLHFPASPAIFFCHGWFPWMEIPPKFSRILRYIGTSTACCDRMVEENGIAKEKVHLLLNFVDTDRFKITRPLPKRPKRALFYNHSTSALVQVQLACKELGINLDAIGYHHGNPANEPESVLNQYDLIFAVGRSAIEAMAVGAAVILCDAVGLGPLVTADRFKALRLSNFGSVSERLNKEAIIDRINRYNAEDAQEVTRLIRSEAKLDHAIEQIILHYNATIEDFSNYSKNADKHICEQRDASSYIRWLKSYLIEYEKFKNDYDMMMHEYKKLKKYRSQRWKSSIKKPIP